MEVFFLFLICSFSGKTISFETALTKQIKYPNNAFNTLCYVSSNFKGVLSGLRQFLATEIPLKMMKNAFYYASKALSVLKIFTFLS